MEGHPDSVDFHAHFHVDSSHVDECVAPNNPPQDPPPISNNDQSPTEPMVTAAQAGGTVESKMKKKPPKRKSSGFGRTLGGRNKKSTVVAQHGNGNGTVACGAQPPQPTMTQLKQRVRNQDRTIANLRSEIDQLNSTNSALKIQLAAKDAELKSAMASSRRDKKASNQLIHSSIVEANLIKQDADNKMKEAQAVKLAAESHSSRAIHAERRLSSIKLAEKEATIAIKDRELLLSKSKIQQVTAVAKSKTQQVKAAATSKILQVKEVTTAKILQARSETQQVKAAARNETKQVKEAAKSEILQVKATADSAIKSLKRKHSETLVEMKAAERDRKKRHGVLVQEKNRKLFQMKDTHDRKVAEMQEFLDDMAGDWKMSENAAILSKKRQAIAAQDAANRLEKLMNTVDQLNELKDDLDEAVRLLDLCILCCLMYVI
jgi:myosin heavy subunit